MSSQQKPQPRSAGMGDIEELVRLRGYLLSSGSGAYVARTPEEDALWKRAYRAWLRRVLASDGDGDGDAGGGAVQVSVIGAAPALLACAVAVVDQRAPTAHCPSGRSGWVQTVVVDPAARRGGLGGLVMDHALGWLRGAGAEEVVLQTTDAGSPLYRKLGFRPSGEELLSLSLGGA
ncbi:GNAT family N-acetyltransferase [Streptomyces sp. NBC_00654]|uniref:GNAT family N-acetyltransferase n=1 Tax=Streptomyces sp. NBC_00654 TaxID=2975799 RepID=UPI00224F1BE6|nr:GNAT family N-acetyltransferase [Streptomyces sp. NBC_00654]MCX4963679.1 GNAT family N-acetyltransferase [Streptomyces sp. NBC_00654]